MGDKEVTRERKMMLTLIYATKMVDVYVKWFHLMRGVHIMCFFLPFNVVKKQL